MSFSQVATLNCYVGYGKTTSAIIPVSLPCSGMCWVRLCKKLKKLIFLYMTILFKKTSQTFADSSVTETDYGCWRASQCPQNTGSKGAGGIINTCCSVDNCNNATTASLSCNAGSAGFTPVSVPCDGGLCVVS